VGRPGRTQPTSADKAPGIPIMASATGSRSPSRQVSPRTSSGRSTSNYLDPDRVDIPAYEADRTPSSNRTPGRFSIAYGPQDPASEPASRTADNHPHPGWTAESFLDLDRSGAAPSFPGCLSARSRNIRDL
jgi:hypothetical protein